MILRDAALPSRRLPGSTCVRAECDITFKFALIAACFAAAAFRYSVGRLPGNKCFVRFDVMWCDAMRCDVVRRGMMRSDQMLYDMMSCDVM